MYGSVSGFLMDLDLAKGGRFNKHFRYLPLICRRNRSLAAFIKYKLPTNCSSVRKSGRAYND